MERRQLLQLTKKIKKYANRISLYKRKKDTMGLSATEHKAYIHSLVEHFRLRNKVFDILFNKTLNKHLLKGRAEELFVNYRKLTGWNLELLVDDKDFEKFRDRCKGINREILLKGLFDLYGALYLNLRNLLNKEHDDYIYNKIYSIYDKDICRPMSYKNLYRHLEFKFEIMRLLIMEQGDDLFEKIKESELQ